MGTNHPCYKCTERHQGCHSTCEKGLAEEAKNRAICKARNAEREIDAYTAQKQYAIDKIQKKLERRGMR